ncbi:MAG TPA: metalloregulator ArsR/SmtB family transcription factor [Candidatus Acidoferrum sp.]|nr:metalloregulator ArsR/SmtB family transcription factor [Candidatus Acidoferrum sp.]
MGSAKPDDSLSSTFAALADPTRRAILARLTTGEASVRELAAPFSISERAISKHVGVLQRAGLVSRSRDSQRRLSRIEATPLHDVYSWLDDYRELWTGRFDRIAQVVKRAKRARS